MDQQFIWMGTVLVVCWIVAMSLIFYVVAE